MKVLAILLVVCLSATVVSGQGIVRNAIDLLCKGVIPLINIALDVLLAALNAVLNGALGLLSGLPLIGGVLGGVLNLNLVGTVLGAAQAVKNAVIGQLCGPNGTLEAVYTALCA